MAGSNPLTPHYRDKANQTLPVHPQSGRIGYREWYGYLFAGGEKGAMSLPAETVVTYAEVMGSGGTLLAAGYVTDNMKTEDYVEATFPCSRCATVSIRCTPRRNCASGCWCRPRWWRVNCRCGVIASLGGDFKKTTIAAAVEAFWIATEGDFREAIGAAVEGLHALAPEADVDTALRPLRERWLMAMRRAALDIFQQSVPLDTLGDLPTRQREAIITANRFCTWCCLAAASPARRCSPSSGWSPPSASRPATQTQWEFHRDRVRSRKPSRNELSDEFLATIWWWRMQKSKPDGSTNPESNQALSPGCAAAPRRCRHWRSR